MSNVLLLRAANQDSPDRYEDAFRSRGYHPISVPVLESVTVGCEELARRLSIGPEKQSLSGVIITSQRAVEAWSEAAQALIIADSNMPLKPESDWWSVPFYAVGEATSVALRDLSEKIPLYTPRDIRGGSETGTAERLAGFILKDLPSDGTSKKLLYLTGDKNRDILPRILESDGVTLDSLQVYATQGSSMFPHDLSLALEHQGLSWGWIVYFAPSVAEFVTPILRNHFTLPAVNSSIEDYSRLSEHHHVKVAAIGPTTESFLQQILKLSVAVTARNPKPDDLADGVLQHDEAQ
ncbi:tetrapyrrole biosynthesis, uroporphyrinogen III synthase [Suillus fuscotomentosus]|uniref:Tetrapyrrole biosynthesis, uroporphyrinogen III synthase n=1 Tax=Suillus fuscotomentosus TaxID=1912939 RepID=A0AAD4HF62_9AGAM|nr:tetrapyrrole biosynthesis, uroporphyrinogen III synthase [Suillus fuscotomentosus]KAG1893936.1 tetrapyrrole biosynthesis, uroporphyrinogen III synthase [Suillus fuscotomentosus]